jgi:hypothetical protein
MSSEGFSAPEKNAMICPQSAVLPILSGITGICRLQWLFGTFFKIWTCWIGCGSLLQNIMAVWCASNFKKERQTAILSLRSLSRIVCKWQERKVSTATWSLISRPILDLCYFKVNVTTRNRKSRYNFDLIMLTLWGQESPLMNKKGLNTTYLSLVIFQC